MSNYQLTGNKFVLCSLLIVILQKKEKSMAVKNCGKCKKCYKTIKVGDNRLFSFCSSKLRIYGEYIDSDQCSEFEEEQITVDKECYLFSDEEWNAMFPNMAVPIKKR